MNLLSRFFGCLVLCVSFLSFSIPSHAQTASTMDGAVVGTVTDSSDAAIPNVTVTLSGAAVMGDKKVATDGNGVYRFLALTPGDYRLSFESSGFGMQTRDGIHVSLGFTATVNVQMAVGTVTENITVNSETSSIDLESNHVTTDLEAPALASLPGSRDLWAVLSMTPAIAETKMDVGGSDALTQQGYSVYGLSGSGGGGINRGEVEGMMVNEGSGGGGSEMFYADYGAMQTISVNAANNTAEMPEPGVLSDMIAKTGGNEFHGDFYFDYENGGMEWHNINSAQIATLTAGGVIPTAAVPLDDVNRLNLFRDLSANVGGYIIKNKLWWFVSYRYTVTEQNYPTLNESQTSWSPNYTGKITYNLTNKQRLVGFYTHSNKYQPDYLNAMVLSGGRQGGALETGPTAWNSSYPVYVYDGEYIYDITPSLEATFQGGNYFSGWTRLGKSSQPRIEDTGSNYVSGGQSNTENDRHRAQFRGSVSYIHSGWFGTHNFKFGAEYMRDTNFTPWNSLGIPGALDPSVPCPAQIGGVLGTMCQTVSVLNNGASLDAYFYALGPYTANFGNSTVGIYGNDTWQLSRRFTVNVGLRFDRQRLFNQAEVGPNNTTFAATNYFAFNNFGPRVGISYDLSGKGTSVVKASFGHYFNYPAADYASSFNPDRTGWYYEYLWSPVGASSTPGSAACKGPLNLGDTANSYYQPGQCLGSFVTSVGGAATTTFSSALKLANTYQASAYYEQQIGGFTLRSGIVFNHTIDPAGAINLYRPLSAYSNPVTYYVPNAANQISNSSPTITLWDTPSTFNTAQNVQIYQNLPENGNYYNWEVTATKSSRDHYFTLLGSFNYTWLRVPNLGSGTSFTPNQFINTIGCADTTTVCTSGVNAYDNWQGKIDSQVHLPYGIKFSPILRLQAGTPFGRTFTTGKKADVAGSTVQEPALNLSYTILAEPFGTERTPTQVLFDIRTEKEFTIKDRVTATGFFDVYNIFNTNVVTALTSSTGSAFLLPSNIMPPRIIRVGVKLGF